MTDSHELDWACSCGDLAAARAIVARAGGALDRAANWRLCIACENNHLIVAEWVLETFVFHTDAEHASVAHIFRKVCENGYKGMAAWLKRRFNISAATVRAERNAALRSASAGGHLEMARWLVEQFALRRADTRGAARQARKAGHYDVAAWLDRCTKLKPTPL